ncbi:hypothetical protein DSECCO2_270630 [anaerobic digester metagenome]
MDRFEAFTAANRGQKPAARGAELERLAAQCACPDCPTYNDCSEGAGECLYCLVGRSFGCMTENLGCACAGCTVHRALDLEFTEFCIHGPEAARRYERTLP